MDKSNDYLPFIREMLEQLMLDRKLLPIKCFFFYRPVRTPFLLKFDETRMIL